MVITQLYESTQTTTFSLLNLIKWYICYLFYFIYYIANKSNKKIKISNELILLANTVCQFKIWYIWFPYAKYSIVAVALLKTYQCAILLNRGTCSFIVMKQVWGTLTDLAPSWRNSQPKVQICWEDYQRWCHPVHAVALLHLQKKPDKKEHRVLKLSKSKSLKCI